LGTRESWRVLLVEWESGKDRITGSVEGVNQAFDFHPKEKMFVVGTGGKSLEIRDYAGRLLEEAVSLGDDPVAVRFSPDGRFLAVATRAGVDVLRSPTGERTGDSWRTGNFGVYSSESAVAIA